jgi:hypothetical protein
LSEAKTDFFERDIMSLLLFWSFSGGGGGGDVGFVCDGWDDFLPLKDFAEFQLSL